MRIFDHDATNDEVEEPILAPESTPWQFVAAPYSAAQGGREGPAGRRASYPEQAVEAFRDLGLNDQEIAAYFGIEPRYIGGPLRGGQRSGQPTNLRALARQMGAKLFGGYAG